MNNNSMLDEKRWIDYPFTLDISYILKQDLGYILLNGLQLLHLLSKQTKDSIFGIFTPESLRSIKDFLLLLQPVPRDYFYKDSIYSISVKHPPESYDNIFCKADKELLTTIIHNICFSILGPPQLVFQEIANDIYILKDPSNWMVDDFVEKGCVVWDEDTYLAIFNERYTGTPGKYFKLHSPKLKELIPQGYHNLGVNLESQNYKVGVLNNKYPLSTFPQYIQDYTEVLIEDMFSQSNYPESYNVMIHGEKGTGKTMWCQSFAYEVLAPKGYLVFLMDFETLKSYIIPDHYEKVCVILNDVDNLCLNREDFVGFGTEKVLDWLDNTRNSFLTSVLSANKSIITLMTANSLDNWDEAGLRKGRIEKHYLFDESLLPPSANISSD